MTLSKPSQLSLTLSSVLVTTLAGPALAQSADIQPTQPGNPQIQLYPGAGGEVFWQRSTDDRGVIGYEITRNGVDLGIRDVLSVYDPSLVPDTPYTFTIAAVDTAGQRSAVATVSISGDTVASSGDPTIAPSNLSIQVYSSTAAELFWQPSTFIDRNEIRRNGVLITTRSGGATRSFYDDTREPGRTYTYEVTAFNGGGQGSATIGDNDTPITTDGEIQTGTTGISGDFPVQLAVYDAQSFELSWDRIAGAASYRLQRDGQTVQESNGISRYVAGINSSVTFSYTLAALDASGNTILSTDFTVAPRGTPQLAATDSTTQPPEITGPSGNDARVIASDTYVDVLAYAFEIYTGKRLRDDVLALPGFPLDILDYTPPLSERDGTVTVSAVCDNGGTVGLDETVTGVNQTTTTREYAFTDCQTGTAVRDGVFVSRNFGNLNLTATDFQIVDGPTSVGFSGGLSYKFTANRDGGPSRNYGLTEANLTIESETPATLEDASFTYEFVIGNFAFRLDGGYTIASPFTTGRNFTVTTTDTLSYSSNDPGAPEFIDSPRFSTGTLQITDPNGDSITLFADNGDSATADVEVVSDGVTERFVEPWSTWADELDFFDN